MGCIYIELTEHPSELTRYECAEIVAEPNVRPMLACPPWRLHMKRWRSGSQQGTQADPKASDERLDIAALNAVAAQDRDACLRASFGGDTAINLNACKLLAEQGDADAQYKLGLMYYAGDGLLQDYAAALRWFRLVADQGFASAQYNLAEMYENGEGILQANVVAHMWFNLASANGIGYSGQRRDEIADKMTTADISEAQRRARVCMASNYTDCD